MTHLTIIHGAYLARLGDAGLVQERSTRVLGLFTRRRWYLTGAGDAAAPRQRLDALVRGTKDSEPRTVALAAVARATRMDRPLYPGQAGGWIHRGQASGWRAGTGRRSS